MITQPKRSRYASVALSNDTVDVAQPTQTRAGGFIFRGQVGLDIGARGMDHLRSILNSSSFIPQLSSALETQLEITSHAAIAFARGVHRTLIGRIAESTDTIDIGSMLAATRDVSLATNQDPRSDDDSRVGLAYTQVLIMSIVLATIGERLTAVGSTPPAPAQPVAQPGGDPLAVNHNLPTSSDDVG